MLIGVIHAYCCAECWVKDQALISTFLCFGLDLCTKSMGLSFLCLVLMLEALVSNPTTITLVIFFAVYL